MKFAGFYPESFYPQLIADSQSLSSQGLGNSSLGGGILHECLKRSHLLYHQLKAGQGAGHLKRLKSFAIQRAAVPLFLPSGHLFQPLHIKPSVSIEFLTFQAKILQLAPWILLRYFAQY